jgi:hypothetical protein
MKSFKVSYADKTKLRELLFRGYVEGQIDKSSLISRLEVSERQFYRLRSKYLVDKTLAHGLTSIPSNRRINDVLKSQIVSLYKNEYRDLSLNYQHFQELLALRDNIYLSASSLRNILLSEKLTLPRKRKGRIFMRREPKAKFNQMLQLDGTFGDFLGDGRMLCLMHLVDDATKTSLAMLFEAECTNSALTLLYHWCLKYGIPDSIYSDRHSTYKVNERQRLTIEEELEGTTNRLSEFGMVCKKLVIKQIFAHSPQAKGRVEKKHQLYKDRWVKELRLNKITTITDANKFLFEDGGFIDRLNDKFTIKPKEARSATVLPTESDLAQQFSIESTRTVRNDYTVSFKSVVYQIIKVRNIKPRSKVQISQHLDGSMTINFNKNKLEYVRLDNYLKPEIKKEKINPYFTTKRTSSTNEAHPYKVHYKPERKNQKPSDYKQLDLIAKLYG